MRSLPSRRLFLTLAGAAVIALRAPVARAVIDRPTNVFVWRGGGPFFGGFSAIDLSSDRLSALTISDRGFAVRVRLIRDANGQLIGVEKIDHFMLLDVDGHPVSGRRADSEGMDVRPDGSLFVAFEGWHDSRIMRYRNERGVPEPLARHPDWNDFPSNVGLEALAIDARGVVYVIPESASNRAFPLYRLENNHWTVVAQIPALGGFVPVGADFGPDGNLYLLERKFRVAFFATRISRLRPGYWGIREILVETSYGVLDNHEGISVTRDAAGQLWATTISDDNQHRLQRTEIAEFALPDA